MITSTDNINQSTSCEDSRKLPHLLSSDTDISSSSMATSEDSADEDFIEETETSDDSSPDLAERLVSNSRISPTLRDFGIDVIRYINIELQSLFEGQHNFASHTTSSGPSTGSCAPPQSPSRTRPQQNPTKSSLINSSHSNDGQDDHPDKRQKLSSCSPHIRQLCARLACPFFKNNPAKYQNWTSCPGPGWASVHRIKYV
jgi:hypothetical protein